MCLISVCPRGTSKVSKKVEDFINEGVTSNTDGSGIMYKRHGTDLINIKKGLEGFDGIMEAIEAARLSDDDELIIHHRTGTSGLTNAINTHPFIISEDIQLMRSIEGSFNLPAMAHNGVFMEYTNKTSEYNDTFHFVNEFLAVPEVLALLRRDPVMFKRFFGAKIGTQRLAFLFPERDFMTFGEFLKDDGYFHSNIGYKTFTRDVGGSSNEKKEGKTCAIEQARKDAWEDYYDRLDKMKENNKNFNKMVRKAADNTLRNGKTTGAEKYAKQVKFEPGDIPITKKNFHHFMFTLKAKIINSAVDESTVYALEKYDEEDQFGYVFEYPRGKMLIRVNLGVFLQKAKVHVKEEFEMIYRPMKNLIDHCDREPSKSLMKKVQKRLNSGILKNEMKFKNFGIIQKTHLQHFSRMYGKSYQTINENLAEKDSDVNTNMKLV